MTAKIFIRADVTFCIDGFEYVNSNHPVSLFGVMGIRSNDFDPTALVGVPTKVVMRIRASTPFILEVNGNFVSEVTKDSIYLGIRYNLTHEQRNIFKKAIDDEGYYPADYIRKYPRIPAADELPEMPMRAIIRGGWRGDACVLDIANISPGGLLLYSENQNASLYTPGNKAAIQIEPRGSLFNPFKCTALICRQTTEMVFPSKTLRRFLGMKFVSFSDQDKANFLVMLKAVLNNIKKSS